MPKEYREIGSEVPKTKEDFISFVIAYIKCHLEGDIPILKNKETEQAHVVKLHPELFQAARELQIQRQKQDPPGNLKIEDLASLMSPRKDARTPAFRNRIRNEKFACDIFHELSGQVSNTDVYPFQLHQATFFDDHEFHALLDIGLSRFDPTFVDLGQALMSEARKRLIAAREINDDVSQKDFEKKMLLAITDLREIYTVARYEDEAFEVALGRRLESNPYLSVLDAMLRDRNVKNSADKMIPLTDIFTSLGFVILFADPDFIGPDSLQNIGMGNAGLELHARKIDTGLSDFFSKMSNFSIDQVSYAQALFPHVGFFFEYATSEEKLIGLLPIITLNKEEILQLVKEKAIGSGFKEDEIQHVSDAILQRYDFLRHVFLQELTAAPDTLNVTIPAGKHQGKSIEVALKESKAGKELLQELIILSPLAMYDVLQANAVNESRSKRIYSSPLSIDQSTVVFDKEEVAELKFFTKCDSSSREAFVNHINIQCSNVLRMYERSARGINRKINAEAMERLAAKTNYLNNAPRALLFAIDYYATQKGLNPKETDLVQLYLQLKPKLLPLIQAQTLTNLTSIRHQVDNMIAIENKSEADQEAYAFLNGAVTRKVMVAKEEVKADFIDDINTEAQQRIFEAYQHGRLFISGFIVEGQLTPATFWLALDQFVTLQCNQDKNLSFAQLKAQITYFSDPNNVPRYQFGADVKTKSPKIYLRFKANTGLMVSFHQQFTEDARESPKQSFFRSQTFVASGQSDFYPLEHEYYGQLVPLSTDNQCWEETNRGGEFSFDDFA